MGFFSAVKKFFGRQEEKDKETGAESAVPVADATVSQTADQDELSAERQQRIAGGKDEALESDGTAQAIESGAEPEQLAPTPDVTLVADSDAVATQSGEVASHIPVPESETPPASDEVVHQELEKERVQSELPSQVPSQSDEDVTLTLRLRQAEPRLSAWLEIILEGVEEVSPLLWERLHFLLHALDAPKDEAEAFVNDFRAWVERNEYEFVEEFRSELQYRLALALDMEDEEDERARLFVKITEGLTRTREYLAKGLNTLFAAHGELNEKFWDELTELFIMADLGYEASLELVERIRERAGREGVKETGQVRKLLQSELEAIFHQPRQISAVNPPEVVLFIGVNGVGKTTTIAKLAQRARMQGKKVLIAAADTFRAAAIEQLQVWAERVGALFHAKTAGSDPASVAFEAMDLAVREKVDILFVDTAGRLQTKVNLMEELGKIRQVLAKKHPGAPHRTVLVIDATTGQNALSQTKLFKEAAGVDELILTKLDGTAKGGVAIAVAMQHHLPISFVGLGEKLEDLRPFDGNDYARALLGETREGKEG